MARITSIEAQVKDKSRCNLYIDGKFFCGLKVETAVRLRLKVGDVVDEKSLENIIFEEEKGQALEKALVHVSATRKTKKQIEDFLRGKGYTDTIIEQTILKMEETELIDDRAYCRAFIEGARGKGKRRLAFELGKKGIDDKISSEILGDCDESTDEIKALFYKYLRGKTMDKKTLSKAFKYLLARGYSYDNVKAALMRITDFDGEDEE